MSSFEYYDIEDGSELLITITNWRLGIVLDEWIEAHYGPGWRKIGGPKIKPKKGSTYGYELTIRIGKR